MSSFSFHQLLSDGTVPQFLFHSLLLNHMVSSGQSGLLVYWLVPAEQEDPEMGLGIYGFIAGVPGEASKMGQQKLSDCDVELIFVKGKRRGSRNEQGNSPSCGANQIVSTSRKGTME